MIMFESKTALITGASSGIGEVFAHEFAKRGCNLVLVARSKEKLAYLAGKLESKHKIKVLNLPMDLTSSDAVDSIKREVKMRELSIDILVNNAGAGTFGSFHEINSSRILREIQLNIIALTELTKVFLAPMIQNQDGIIINVASMTAFQPAPYMAVYGATKSYVLSFTQALAAENKEVGIRFLALCPGETKSSFHVSSGSDHLKGNRMEPIDAVNAAFKGIEKGTSYQIVGKANYLLSVVSRLLPRKVVLNIVANMFKK